MGVANCRTISLAGPVGHLVDVQVDVSPGKPGVTIIGRADTALQESRERCRRAVANSDLSWPTTKRTTVLLSPADLAKRGTHFDLAIALAIVAADGQLGAVDLSRTVMIGELTLDGRLRAVPGVLPMALAAADRGIDRIFVPEPQAHEAAMVPGLSVFGLRSLAQAVAVLTGKEIPEAPEVAETSGAPLLGHGGVRDRSELDLADLDGLEVGKLALEVAAAGGHHLCLSGPKGSGKTSLVERLPGLLPDLAPQDSLQLSVLQSLAGNLEASTGLPVRPPYLAPHHDASATSLLGGGTGRVRPGAVSLAHAGVLFLDELPLFRTDVLDGLREPLESREITVARGEETVTYPAGALLVAASNPCPCGNYGVNRRAHQCECDELSRRHYRRRLRGPVLDRLDLQVSVRPSAAGAQAAPWACPESSADVRARVVAARARQRERYAGRPWWVNAHVPSPELVRQWPLPADCLDLVDQHVFDGSLTRRGAVRVHRIAWTLADLAGRDQPGDLEVTTALALRMDTALPAAALERAG